MDGEILIVDDDVGTVSVLKEFLESKGFRVRVATDGNSAYLSAKETIPSLIILDVILPEMDGLQLCRLIREEKNLAEVPIILLTAMDDREQVVKGLEAGANDFVQKPFYLQEIYARVRNLLAIKSYSDKLKEKNQQLEKIFERISRINRELEELARIDSLTNIWNRRALEEELHRQHKLSVRYNLRYSLMMVDLDYFKGYNDYYGHIAGDELLKNFAQLLKQEIRGTDFVGRYGGEEFLIIMPNTTAEGGLAMGGRIKRRLEELGWEHKMNPLNGKVTFSAGVSTFDPSEGIDQYEVLRRADVALYAAKEGGRNCCKIYDPSMENK